MRNAILGTIAGLLVGTVGAVAYDHYLGDGSLLADLQAKLDSTESKLKDSEQQVKFLTEQNKSSSDQLDQVVASNDQLKKQLASGGTAPADATPEAAPAAPTITPDMIRGLMGMMRGGGPGGFRSPEQRMFLLQSRLKLDPDQAKAIKAAMDADNQARRDAFRQARQNGTRPDPAAMNINTVDKTMAEVLSPAQQTAYQQEQADEKAARAESTATSQVDNLMPLLQLTDEQKEKAINALYQQQTSAPDAGSMMNNPNPLGALAQQGQSAQAAMKAVLTPDQYALYQQDGQMQAQAMANFGGGGRNRGGGNGGNGGGQGQGQPPGGPGSGGAPSTTTATPAAATPTPTATASSSTDSSSTTNAASATTNAPSATTNAASADAAPPPPPPN